MRTLIGDVDLFFLSQDFFDKHQAHFPQILVMPKHEYHNHTVYSNIRTTCNYGTWAMTYDLVAVAEPKWYEAQPAAFQFLLLEEQKWNHSDMIHDNRLLTTQYLRQLTADQLQAIIQSSDEPLSNVDIRPLQVPDHLARYHNTYADQHGPNCFAAAIFGITRNTFLLHQWLHQEAFLSLLARNGYKQTPSPTPQPGDVICLYEDDRLVHAMYAIDETHCFNKDSQTFHSPWGIFDTEIVLATWPGTTHKRFRA